MSKRGNDERFMSRLSNDRDKGPMPPSEEIFVAAANSPIPPRDNKFRAENEELKGQVAQLQEMLANRGSGLALQDNSLMVEGFQFSPTGLIAPDGMGYDAWVEVGKLIFRLEGSIQWLIGDWLVQGEGVGYGEHTAIAESLGREPKTLYDYTYVARNVPFSVRTENLSWAHHSRVAKMPVEDQVRALQFAVDRKLSFAAFRQWIGAGMPEEWPPSSALEARDTAPSPTLLSDEGINYAALPSPFKSLSDVDPSKAKQQDHERARQIVAANEHALEAFKRRWGIK
jgi:hypothetical protein